MEEKRQTLRDLCDYGKCSNIYITRIWKREKKRKLKEIIHEDFPNSNISVILVLALIVFIH